eukprot:6178783-Pleurochrysis_carterae.AAC.4
MPPDTLIKENKPTNAKPAARIPPAENPLGMSSAEGTMMPSNLTVPLACADSQPDGAVTGGAVAHHVVRSAARSQPATAGLVPHSAAVSASVSERIRARIELEEP